MERDEVLLALRRAKALLEEGWCQNTPRTFSLDGDAQYCMSGAVHASHGSISVVQEALRLLKMKMIANYPLELGTLSDWNDRIGRSKKEVVRLVQETIWDLEQHV
jgi:hypothetical protein